MGAAPLRWQSVAGGGYAENTADWRVELEDGRRVFVKYALDDLAAGWLRKEHRVYAAVSAAFMPELVGWHDGDRSLLVLEDLGDAHWPPPWRDGDVDVRHAAVGLRLAPREADLHLAVPELGPAARSIEVRLGEAKRLAVEAAARVEVAHVVPDRHGSPTAFASAA